jgi:hypothetical protein
MRQSMLAIAVSVLATGVFSAALGCAPKLGDACNNRADCSVNNDRDCDLAQPGGYCTIANCEPNSCGEDGVCVRFKPDEPRLSANWCMATCGNTGDCDRDRYVCLSAEQLNEKAPKGRRVAEVLEGRDTRKFCVVGD